MIWVPKSSSGAENCASAATTPRVVWELLLHQNFIVMFACTPLHIYTLTSLHTVRIHFYLWIIFWPHRNNSCSPGRRSRGVSSVATEVATVLKVIKHSPVQQVEGLRGTTVNDTNRENEEGLSMRSRLFEHFGIPHRQSSGKIRSGSWSSADF